MGGMYPAHTRKFNGQVFTVTSRAKVKGQAEKTAKAMRKKGWLARVVPYKVVKDGITWYAVYVRKA